MKKFMVLGIGNSQIDLLQRLSGHYEVHGVANSPDGPGLRFVEHFHQIDIRNFAGVEECAAQNGVDLIYSIGSDLAVPTISFVAERLGLAHFVPSEVAVTCQNKLAMRMALGEMAANIPFLAATSASEIPGIQLPAVVKPADSQGQRGVSTVARWSDFSKAYSSALAHSTGGEVIIEQKIFGQEISVNGYLRDGEVVFAILSDRNTWEGIDGGVPRSHDIPSSVSPTVEVAVRSVTEEVCSKLGILNGPVYLQLMVSGSDVFVIEVTPRLDGCHMWRLIRALTGVDLIDFALSDLEGERKAFPKHFSTKVGSLEFFTQLPGEKFAPHDPRPGAEYVEWYLEPGQKVPIVNGRLEKIGYQVNVGDSFK